MSSGVVGSFPGLRELNRRTIRGPVNPMDKCTIVSIFPKNIRVQKITLIPGNWRIPPGSVEKPSFLVVGPSSWFKETDLNEPLLEIPQSSLQIADSIVKDYCNGILGCDMGMSMPGLFYVPGAKLDIKGDMKYDATLDWVRTEHLHLFTKAIESQKNYYLGMLRLANTAWAASNGNPAVINDEMRQAAKILGQEDQDWMKEHQVSGNIRCFACGAMKPPAFAVCQTCGIIDPQHPQAAVVLAAQKMFRVEEKLPATPHKVG